MIVRHAVVAAASIAFACAGVACGAGPDGVGKDGKGINGSPNDPGWQPPGANPGPSPDNGNPQPGDDQGEQQPDAGNPNPNCPPMAAAMLPENWEMHTTSSMTIDTPIGWTTTLDLDPVPATGGVDFEVTSDPSFGKMGGPVLVVTLQEFPVAKDLTATADNFKVALEGRSGHDHVVIMSNFTFGCDPAMRLDATGQSDTVGALFVLHEGHVFSAVCTAARTSDATCMTALDTWRITK